MNFSRPWRRCSPDRLRLARFALPALIMALAWQTPAPVIAQEACGHYAVAIAHIPPGQPLTDDVVTLMTPEGEIGRADFAEPLSVVPSPKPGVALVRSLGGVFGLLDSSTGAITPLQIPEDDQSRIQVSFPTVLNASESDFMLLSDVQLVVWLVDLSSGDALDIRTLSEDDPIFIESAAISPDGDWLIYSLQDEGYFVSLETPGSPTPIDIDPLLPYPVFDSAGNVVYLVEGESGRVVRSLDPATGERTELASVPDVDTLPIQRASQLLLLDGDRLLTLPDGAQTPQPLFEWEGNIEGVLTDLDGAHLVVGDDVDDLASWYRIELATGKVTELPELEGMFPISRTRFRDAFLFAPSIAIGPGTPGAPYRSLDMRTGVVTTPLTQDSNEVWQVFDAGDDVGRYSFVNAVDPGTGRIWLIDNQTGTATLAGVSSGNAKAVVSPDGCQLAVSIFDTVGEGRTSSVTVTSLLDGSTTLTVQDAMVLGWAEAPGSGQRP